MKLIDADAIIAALESFSDRAHGNQHYLNGIGTAKELIAEADEAVVRCGDCRYFGKDKDDSEEWTVCGYRWQHYPFMEVEPSDYCSHGEWGTNEAD